MSNNFTATLRRVITNCRNKITTTLTKGADRERLRLSKLQILFLVCSVILLITGIIVGDCTSIFHKAVFVCMECIGIG